MKEFNTRVAEGDYSITFETDDRKAFEQVQTLCRILVDGKDGDAIPVEWIKKWISKGLLGMDSLIDPEITIQVMLKCWEKENE